MSSLIKNFLSKIDKTKVNSVLELGARDGKETLEINNYFNPEIFVSFEANPHSYEITKKNILNYKNIKLIQKS